MATVSAIAFAIVIDVKDIATQTVPAAKIIAIVVDGKEMFLVKQNFYGDTEMKMMRMKTLKNL